MFQQQLTLWEAARYLGVSRAKLSRLAKEGILHFRHSPLDRRVKLFRIDDLDDILARSRRLYPPLRRRPLTSPSAVEARRQEPAARV